jgi:hypothetical protein
MIDIPMNSRPAPQYFVRKCSRPYQPAFARQAERLTLFGATRAVLEDWFAVDAATIERWALEHPEFSNALKVKPIGVTREDCGLFFWLKDYWLGNLAD